MDDMIRVTRDIQMKDMHRPVEVGGVAGVDELQHLPDHVRVKVLDVHRLVLLLCHVCLEHGSEHRGPKTVSVIVKLSG